MSENEHPVYIEYLAPLHDLHSRRAEVVQAAELRFYKDHMERFAGMVETMAGALEQGKTVRFQGMEIVRKPPAEQDATS